MSDLSRALVLVGLLTPVCANGLGVGEVRQHSSLNQPLNAEIPLALSGDDAVDKLKIGLATPEAFSSAGIARSHVLSQLRFRTVTKPNGQHFILVTSAGSIQEPFLNFLLEVHSDQGAVMREFTILLDPADQDTGVPSYPITDHSFSQFSETSSSDDVEAPIDSGHSERAERPQQRTPEQSTVRQELSPIVVSNDLLTGEVYGPVRRHEKLMEIARRIHRPPAVSVEEMAWGIYWANPNAFRQGIDGLKAGSLLRLPNATFLAQYSSENPNQTLKAPNSQAETQHLASTEHTHSQFSTRTVPDPSRQASLALKQENEELRHRLTLVEQKLEEAQRLVVQKTDEILVLKNQTHTNSAQASSPVATTPIEAGIKDDQQTRADHTTAAPDNSSPQTPQPIGPPSYPTTNTAEATVTEKASRESRISPPYGLVSGALVLIGLGALAFRRRHVFTFAGNDKIQSGSEQNRELIDSMADNPVTAQLANVHIEEVNILDPLAEADVYIRYGRFAQAEKLMMEAIRKEPARHNLKLKLLEIYNLSGQIEAFSDYQEYLEGQKVDIPSALSDKLRAMRPHAEIGAQEYAPDPGKSEPSQAKDQHTDPATNQDTPYASYDTPDFAAELIALEAEYSGTASRAEATVPAHDTEQETAIRATAADRTPQESHRVSGPSSAIEPDTSNDLMDLSDTDFTQELRSLEAEYTTEPAVNLSIEAENGISHRSQESEPVDMSPQIPVKVTAHAIDYVPPSLDQWPKLEQATDAPASFKMQENLVEYEHVRLIPDKETLAMTEFGAATESGAEIMESLKEHFALDYDHGFSASVSHEDGTLDLEDTDFTIELRSLQAKYASEQTPDSVQTSEMELAIADDGEPLSAVRGLPETQRDPLSITRNELQLKPSDKAGTHDAMDRPVPDDENVNTPPIRSAAGITTHPAVSITDANPVRTLSLPTFDKFESPINEATRGAPSPPSPKRFGVLSFDIGLIDPSKSAKTKSATETKESAKSEGSSTAETLLARARIHLGNGETAEAKKLLQELLAGNADQHQKAEAETLLSPLNRVRLSLVTSNGPKLFGNSR